MLETLFYVVTMLMLLHALCVVFFCPRRRLIATDLVRWFFVAFFGMGVAHEVDGVLRNRLPRGRPAESIARLVVSLRGAGAR